MALPFNCLLCGQRMTKRNQWVDHLQEHINRRDPLRPKGW